MRLVLLWPHRPWCWVKTVPQSVLYWPLATDHITGLIPNLPFLSLCDMKPVVSAPFTWASLVAQLVKDITAMQETWVRSLSWEDPLEKGKATLSNILAWRIPWTV